MRYILILCLALITFSSPAAAKALSMQQAQAVALENISGDVIKKDKTGWFLAPQYEFQIKQEDGSVVHIVVDGKKGKITGKKLVKEAPKQATASEAATPEEAEEVIETIKKEAKDAQKTTETQAEETATAKKAPVRRKQAAAIEKVEEKEEPELSPEEEKARKIAETYIDNFVHSRLMASTVESKATTQNGQDAFFVLVSKARKTYDVYVDAETGNVLGAYENEN